VTCVFYIAAYRKPSHHRVLLCTNEISHYMLDFRFAASNMNISVFWNVVMCHLVEIDRHAEVLSASIFRAIALNMYI
jgi:hypothetical protein